MPETQLRGTAVKACVGEVLEGSLQTSSEDPLLEWYSIYSITLLYSVLFFVFF